MNENVLNNCVIKKDFAYGNIYYIESNPNNGFNYPYLLLIPNNVNVNSNIIVEGSNTSGAPKEIVNINNFDKEVNESINEVKRSFIYSDNIILKINKESTKYPVLYPLFPRVRYKDQAYYNHMLSSNTMFPDNEEIVKKLGIFRTDIQLIKMINDAKKKLNEYGLNINEKIIITGFSASGKFANRFALLHPEIIECVIAGGLSGFITLPIKEMHNEKLLWPIGIGNVGEITSEKIQVYKDIPQFYYHGIQDNVDPYKPNENGFCQYNGILQNDEAIQLYKFFGKSMYEERWKKVEELVSSSKYNIVLKSYNSGHDRNIAKEEIRKIF